MSRAPLRVAVVGTNIGCLLHVRALRGAGFDVTTLVGRDADRTQGRAAHFGIPICGTAFEAALDSDIDAVAIATPPGTHHAMTLAAIAAGKHVLCEKPLALNVSQAQEMRDAIGEASLVDQVVHPSRWHPHRAALRDAFRSGLLGTPLQASFLFDNPLLTTGVESLPSWWLDDDTGGGWLRNYASHGIDTVRYLLGDFAAVSATLHNDLSSGMKADDGYAFAFQLVNGAQGTMTGTCRSWDYSDDARIVGSKAAAGYHHTDLWIRDEDGRRPLHASGDVAESLLAGGTDPGEPVETLPEVEGVYNVAHRSDRGYPPQVCLARSFRNRILDPTYAHPAVATFDDGVAHMRVISAVEQSARSRTWIDVDTGS